MLWHTEFDGWLDRDILQYMSTVVFYVNGKDHSTIFGYIYRTPTPKPSSLDFTDHWRMDRFLLERTS